MTELSVEQYLDPIAGESACGVSLRYDRAWDHLRELRREDDASLPSGVWQRDLKRGSWAELEALAGNLLRERSKDLMIAVWLGEAWIRRYGLAGVVTALELLVGLCERYPDDLYPQADDGDRSWRASPLEWMVRQYSETLLAQISLFGLNSECFVNITFHDWLQLQQSQVQVSDKKQDKAVAEAARGEYRKLHEQLRQIPKRYFLDADTHLKKSLVALEKLDAWSDCWLGDLAPSYGPLRGILGNLRAQIEEFVPMEEQACYSAPVECVSIEHPVNPISSFEPSVIGEPSSREQAYRQLSQIADYLAKTEPHSPVPFVIRRAVEWGNQPLSVLLDELINADAESRRVWKMLGVLN